MHPLIEVQWYAEIRTRLDFGQITLVRYQFMLNAIMSEIQTILFGYRMKICVRKPNDYVRSFGFRHNSDFGHLVFGIPL